jgi:hypothetical protein
MVLTIQVEPHLVHVVGDLRKVHIATRSLQHDARGMSQTFATSHTLNGPIYGGRMRSMVRVEGPSSWSGPGHDFPF